MEANPTRARVCDARRARRAAYRDPVGAVRTGCAHLPARALMGLWLTACCAVLAVLLPVILLRWGASVMLNHFKKEPRP